MARSIRIEYAGAYYHVMARGNRREAIFLDDADRKFFLKCLAEACEKTGWRVHAWVLMGNHYHLLLETPEANLVEGMKWLQNTVTRRFNVRHRQWGRLFGDRYKAVLVEGENAQYYTTLWDYIHLNPARAGLVKPGKSILDYKWSSVAGGYALLPGQRPKWLAAEQGLAVLGYADTARGRRQMVAHLDRRAANEKKESGLVPRDEEADGRTSHLGKGWYWGSQEFAERALKVAEAALKKIRRSRAYRTSPESTAHGVEKAEELLAEGLRAAGLKKGDLEALYANDPRKAVLAKILWTTTTVSQGWIADKLRMKGPANVSLTLHRTDWKKAGKKIPATLGEFIRKMQDYAP